MSILDEIKERADREIRFAQKAQIEWRDRFESDPVSAMRQADGTFAKAADERVWNEIKARAGAVGADAGKIFEWVTSEAMRTVRFPTRSTSPSSTLMDQELGRAFAAAAEGIADMIRWAEAEG